jgi:hypothetical protein
MYAHCINSLKCLEKFFSEPVQYCSHLFPWRGKRFVSRPAFTALRQSSLLHKAERVQNTCTAHSLPPVYKCDILIKLGTNVTPPSATQTLHILMTYNQWGGPCSSVGIATDYRLDGPGIESLPLVPKIAGSLPTEAVGFFLMEKSTACSTTRYKRHKRQLKVQYQDNEA